MKRNIFALAFVGIFSQQIILANSLEISCNPLAANFPGYGLIVNKRVFALIGPVENFSESKKRCEFAKMILEHFQTFDGRPIHL